MAAPVSGGFASVAHRRSFVKFAASAMAFVAAAGLPKFVGAAALEDSANYRATTSLNLREKPSTSSTVLLVIPQGGLVQYLSDRSNGFLKVAYMGTWGWLLAISWKFRTAGALIRGM